MDHARHLARERSSRSVWDKRGWSGVTIEGRVSPWNISLAGAAWLIGVARQRVVFEGAAQRVADVRPETRSRRAIPIVHGLAIVVSSVSSGNCTSGRRPARSTSAGYAAAP